MPTNGQERETLPPPPIPQGIPGSVQTDLLRLYSDKIKNFPTNRNQQTDLLRGYSDQINRPAPIPSPPGTSFFGPRPTTNPSFQPMSGETMAGPDLRREMQSVRNLGGRIRDWWNTPSPGVIPLPGYRDLPPPPAFPMWGNRFSSPMTPVPQGTLNPNIYDMRASGAMLAGGGAQSAGMRQLFDRYNDRPMPAYALSPDFLTGLQPAIS